MPLLLATVWVPYLVQVHWERYLGLAPLLRVASGLGSATSGVIAIHQRSICRAGTGSPGLGPSVLLCARCVLYTVLRVGTRRWESVCDQQRRHGSNSFRRNDDPLICIEEEKFCGDKIRLGVFDFHLLCFTPVRKQQENCENKSV